MAGLIDVNILKPELSNALAAGYRGAEQARQQSEMNQMKLEQLKQDRAMLTELQTKLKAAGQSTDPNEFFKALIQTGNPDYMAKGYEGMQRYQELQRAERLLDAEFGAPAAAAPAPANALAAGAPTGAAPVPANAMAAAPALTAAAPEAAAPANAMVAAPDRAQELRRKIMQYRSVNDPRLKAMAEVYEAELKELTKPQVVAPGATLLVGGQTRFTAPAAPSTLARLQSELAALPPGDPRRAEYQALIRKETTHAPGTSVTLVQEKAEKGARGKMLVDQYTDISKQANVAQRTLPALESNLAILDKGFDTGFGTETKAAGAKVLAALGVPDAEKYATNAQTFLGNATQAVLQRQLEQKGPQTESDAQRITQTGAQLGNTKAANQFMLSVAKAQLKRDVEQRNFYDKWWKANNTYDGAEDAWYSGEGGRSLFDRPELKKYLAPGSAAQQIPTVRTPAPAAVPAGKGGAPSVSNW